MSVVRLMYYLEESEAAWERFVSKHDDLIEVWPEEEYPDDEEFVALEIRKTDLMGALAEAIIRLGIPGDKVFVALELRKTDHLEALAEAIENKAAQKILQDKQADEARAQQEKQVIQERAQHESKAETQEASSGNSSMMVNLGSSRSSVASYDSGEASRDPEDRKDADAVTDESGSLAWAGEQRVHAYKASLLSGQGPSPKGGAGRSHSKPGYNDRGGPKSKPASSSHSGQQQGPPQRKECCPFC